MNDHAVKNDTYCVGISILKEIELNSKLFSIGNLSPDAHDGSYHRKAVTHFMTGYKDGLDKYPMADLKEYEYKYFSKEFDEFAIGYFCHLLSDNLWTESIYFKYFEDCNEFEKQIRLSLCYKDYVTLNKILKEKFEIKKIDINIPVNLYIEEISNDALNRIIQELYDDFSKLNDEKDLKVFSYMFIESYIKKTSEECLREIKRVLKYKQFIRWL